MTINEIQERAIKYSVDLRGNQITECYFDDNVTLALLSSELDKHLCTGCNMRHCKHNYGN